MAKFNVGDKVRILDGSNIKNYTGKCVPESMKCYVGGVHVITDVRVHDGGITSYGMEDNCFNWDERGLELVENKRKFKVGGKVKETLPQKIVITTDGKRTTAVLYDGKKRVNEASAVCSDDDEFNFMAGAKIAFERLTEEKEPERDISYLLADGIFGKNNASGLFVVVGDKMIYESGGYDRIINFNANLEGPFSHIDEIYGNAVSFDSIKYGCAVTIWKRKEIK
jgi:hypothetical protein